MNTYETSTSPPDIIYVIKSGRNRSVAEYCKDISQHRIIAIVSIKPMIKQIRRAFEPQHTLKHEGAYIHKDDLIITLSELHKLDELTADELCNTTIIIDEITSVITYLMCGDLQNKFGIYNKLSKILWHCRNLIAMDSDESAAALKLLNTVSNKRAHSQIAIVKDTQQNKNQGKKAIEMSDKQIIKKMRKDIKKNDHFLAIFDNKTKASNIFSTVSAKSKANDFLFISGDDSPDDMDTEKWKGKFVFYTPTIVHGIEYIPDKATNIYMIATGDALTPQALVNQITLCQNINEIYFNITVKK